MADRPYYFDPFGLRRGIDYSDDYPGPAQFTGASGQVGGGTQSLELGGTGGTGGATANSEPQNLTGATATSSALDTSGNARAGGSPMNTGLARPDYSRYWQGGNLGDSAFTGKYTDPAWRAAAQGETNQSYEEWRAEMAKEYPWMADTSVTWGGGPYGYLPINYQAQPYEYYQGPGHYGPSTQLANGRWHSSFTPFAPWEQKYAADTWTQNFDPNAPGYINTRG